MHLSTERTYRDSQKESDDYVIGFCRVRCRSTLVSVVGGTENLSA